MIKGEMHFNDRNVNENYNNSITKLTSRSTYIYSLQTEIATVSSCS